MKDLLDGLDSPELVQDIVAELQLEFPGLSTGSLMSVVEDRRAHMARPATGGALFLEARKFTQLLADEQAEHARMSAKSRKSFQGSATACAWMRT